jgi:hypothetical protein
MSAELKNINELFTSQKGERGPDMSGVITLFVVCCIILMMYFKMTQQQLWLDWDNQKCHPSILFFNGIINPNIDETAFQSIQTNFIHCLKPYATVNKSPQYKKMNEEVDNLVTINRNIEESYETDARKVNKLNRELVKKQAKLDVSFNVIKKIAVTQQDDFEKTFRYVTTNIKRLFVILDRITNYMKDLLIYKVSVNVDRRYMNTVVNREKLGIDQFQDYIDAQYKNIYNNKYAPAFDTMRNIRLRPGFDVNTTDFSQSINLADEAIRDYDIMIQLLRNFESQNQELFEKTNQYCAELKNHNYGCSIILPTWKD